MSYAAYAICNLQSRQNSPLALVMGFLYPLGNLLLADKAGSYLFLFFSVPIWHQNLELHLTTELQQSHI